LAYFEPDNYAAVTANWKEFAWDLLLGLDSSNCDLNAVRRGCNKLCALSGMGWENFSVSFEEKYANVFEKSYPAREERFVVVDAPTFCTLIMKACELFYEKSKLDKIELSFTDDLYRKPGYTKDELPPMLGGTTYAKDMIEWTKERILLREESIRLVKIG